MNNKKIFSKVLMMMIFVITSQVFVPTVYNASEVHDIKVESITEKIQHDFEQKSKSNLIMQNEISHAEEIEEIALNNLTCSRVKKQLSIDQHHTEPLHKYYNFYKTRTINVGVFCKLKLMKIESSPHILSEKYETFTTKGNSIVRLLNEKNTFNDIKLTQNIKINDTEIEKYSRPRDGPKVIDIKLIREEG